MDAKDNVVRFYIKNYVIPRALIFDKPGFVDFRISGKTSVFARQILMPEDLFVEFEKSMIDKFGEAGAQAVYSVGKRFGYSFAQLGRFENIKEHPGNKVKKWIGIASKFVEGTYAGRIDQKVSVEEKTVDYKLKNFVICRKLGYDYLFATGGAAGVIAWLLQDPKIEGYMYNSKSKGEENVCNVLCATPATIKNKLKQNAYSETKVGDLYQDPMQYEALNKEVEIQQKKSFQTFLDARIFSYKKGIISHDDERFFLLEVTGMYLLELAMKDEKMKKTLFDSAFSVGQKMFGDSNMVGITEFLAALGWGEVTIIPSSNKIRVVIKHFPWTRYYKDVEYLLIRGLLSGMLSRIKKKDILLKKPKADLNSGFLTLLFEN